MTTTLSLISEDTLSVDLVFKDKFVFGYKDSSEYSIFYHSGFALPIILPMTLILSTLLNLIPLAQ
jgi:hypothetical protein